MQRPRRPARRLLYSSPAPAARPPVFRSRSAPRHTPPSRAAWAAVSFLAGSALCLAPRLHAQATTGAIVGRVTADVGGAPLAGARVTSPGLARTAVTDARGGYRFDGLAPGAYVIVVTAAGRTPERRTVQVASGGPTTADFALAAAPPLLSDVVVTATRTPESPREVAATVHTLPPERVRTSPARTTDDLLREVPGVELPRTSSTVSGPEQIVSLRGADEGRTLVLLDGVPLNDPWGEWIQWNRAPRFQLDRIEVLEGGGSSLYGSSAMGGVIALHSRPIVARGYQALVDGGSRGAFDGSLAGSNVRGPLGYALGVDYSTGGGYTLLRNPGPVDEANRVSMANVTGRAEYALPTGGTLFATGNYFGDNRTLGTPLTEPNRRRIGAGVLGATVPHVLGGRVEARAYGQRQTYDNRLSVVNAARTSETPNVAQRIPSHDLGGSLQWSRAAGPFEVLSVGGDVRATHGRLDETVYGATAADVVGTRSAGGSQQVGGVFVQGVLAPAAALRVEASARVDAWRSADGSRVDATTTPATVTTYATKTNRAFAPRLGVRYTLLPSLTLRGSYYQGFRAPTLSEEYRTFYAGPNTFNGNPLLTPEYLTGIDGGIDWQPVTRVALRATAFRNHYRDLDDFVFQGPGATPGSAILQRENLGAARATGIEGELLLALSGPFAFTGSYNYDDARVRSTGLPVNRVPLQRVTGRLTYDEARVATVNLVYRYEGVNHALGGGRLAPFGTADVDVRRRVAGGPAGAAGAGTELFVAVENLFDRQYIVNLAGPLQYVGLPRTVRAGVAVRSF